LISLKGAMDLNRLNYPHLRWLARKGKLEATRTGRDWLTTDKAVDLYLNNESRKHDPYKKKSYVNGSINRAEDAATAKR
jgi:hypothetical protein